MGSHTKIVMQNVPNDMLVLCFSPKPPRRTSLQINSEMTWLSFSFHYKRLNLYFTIKLVFEIRLHITYMLLLFMQNAQPRRWPCPHGFARVMHSRILCTGKVVAPPPSEGFSILNFLRKTWRDFNFLSTKFRQIWRGQAVGCIQIFW